MKPLTFKEYYENYRDKGSLKVDQEIAKEVFRLEQHIEQLYEDTVHLNVAKTTLDYRDTLMALSANTQNKLYTIEGIDHKVDIPFNTADTRDNDRAALLLGLAYVIFNDYVRYVEKTYFAAFKRGFPVGSVLTEMKKYI